MTWVKENYDRFLLALLAAVLLACAALLFNNARSFNSVFASLKDQVRQNNTIKPPEQERVVSEQEHLGKPDQWDARIVDGRRLPVFDSVPYITDGEHLVDPLSTTNNAPLHPPVPNRWLMDHGQDLLSPDVLTQDSDGDGFNALDEYLGKTDPQDKNSHPPYWTKLVLTRFVRIPFRFRFDAKNGDSIQINTVDVEGAPTLFLKLGQMVTGTKFKIAKFEQKFSKAKGFNEDVSEVTLQNVDTGETIILPKGKEVDSPTTYAVLNYVWTGKPFAVKKNQEFTLKPEDNVKYKCVDLSDTEVHLVKEDDNKDLHIKMAAPGAPTAPAPAPAAPK